MIKNFSINNPGKPALKTDYFFYLIPVFLIINLFFKWAYFPTISPDSYYYFMVADRLPLIVNSTYPILYPLFLKLVNFVAHDY